MFDILDYKECLKRACETVKHDDFPQVQASDLIYNSVTLKDLYFPVFLSFDDPYKDDYVFDIWGEAYAPPRIGWKDSVWNEERHGDNYRTRLTIRSEAGAGKTMFCRRSAIAFLEDDEEYIDSLYEMTGVRFGKVPLPVYIDFRYMQGIEELVGKGAGFEEIVYRLVCNYLGEDFKSNCSLEGFVGMVFHGSSFPLCFIVDSWDALHDKQLRNKLDSIFGNYLKSIRPVYLFLAVRTSGGIPMFAKDYVFDIAPLARDEMEDYTRQYYKLIYRDNPRKQEQYAEVINEITHKAKSDPAIWRIASLPVALSQLLTLARLDGHLPENKAKLFSGLVNLYVERAAKRCNIKISSEKMIIVLSYIAASMTEAKQSRVDDKWLKDTVQKCIEELSGYFYEFQSKEMLDSLIEEIIHLGFFQMLGSGMYAFTSYRTMQEYLTAYAIVSQNAEEVFDDMSPIEIFRKHYADRGWEDIIVYTALMNDGRLRQSMVKDLAELVKSNAPGSEYCLILLLELVIQGAPMDRSVRHSIYDLLVNDFYSVRRLAESVQSIRSLETDYFHSSKSDDSLFQQIYRLVWGPEDIAVDFVNYITELHEESIASDGFEYGYTMALIRLALGVDTAKESSSVEERFILVDSSDVNELILTCCMADMIAVSEMLVIHSFLNVYTAYTISRLDANNGHIAHNSAVSPETFRAALASKKQSVPVAECIRNCILRNFVTFESVVDEDLLKDMFKGLVTQEKWCEILLSVAPGNLRYQYGFIPGGADFSGYSFDPVKFAFGMSIDKNTRQRYKDRLHDEMEVGAVDEVIFTYMICTLCYSWNMNSRLAVAEIPKLWNEVWKFYHLRDEQAEPYWKKVYSVGNEYFRSIMYHENGYIEDIAGDGAGGFLT